MYSITARRVQNQHVGQPADVPHTKGPGRRRKTKEDGLSVKLQCVLCYAANRKQDDWGEQNQKYKWKHAFKRTTSNSKRGLIKKILNLMNTSQS